MLNSVLVCGVQPPRDRPEFRIFYLIHVNNVGIPYGSITYTQRKTPIIELAGSTGLKDYTWIL